MTGADVEIAVDVVSVVLHGDVGRQRAHAIAQRALALVPDRLSELAGSALPSGPDMRRLPEPLAVPPVELDVSTAPVDVAARRVAAAIADALWAATGHQATARRSPAGTRQALVSRLTSA